MQTWTAMQFPISMLEKKVHSGEVSSQVTCPALQVVGDEQWVSNVPQVLYSTLWTAGYCWFKLEVGQSTSTLENLSLGWDAFFDPSQQPYKSTECWTAMYQPREQTAEDQRLVVGDLMSSINYPNNHIGMTVSI